MVVVTIVSLLVGITVPNYKAYLIRSRVASAFNLMQSYAHLGQEYYEAHGVFGNAASLGLQVGAQNNTLANPQNISKYTSNQIVDIDSGTSGTCYNNITFTFNGTAIGASQNFDIQMVVRYSNGKFVTSCGIPWTQNATTYADVLQYFPHSCREQNVSTCWFSDIEITWKI